MMLSPEANDSHLHPRHARVVVPDLSKAMNQAHKSLLELFATKIATGHVSGPVFVASLFVPVKVDSWYDLDPLLLYTRPLVITEIDYFLSRIALAVFQLIPSNIFASDHYVLIASERGTEIWSKTFKWITQGVLIF